MTGKEPLTDTMWAIKGTWINGKEFFYAGTSQTRREAIAQFVSDLGHSWAQCRARGDRAVKVRIEEIHP